MNESKWEPPAEMVEADAIRVHATYKQAVGYVTPWDYAAAEWRDFCHAEARFVLRRQHERERRLLAGIVRAQEWLSVGSMDTAQHELSETRVWYNKLDAPKVPEAPTLLEAAKAMLRYPAHEHCERWLALEAAVEREEKR